MDVLISRVEVNIVAVLVESVISVDVLNVDEGIFGDIVDV